MGPALGDGECVTVAPVDARAVALGDVVLCETWRGLLAHRVLAIEPDARGVLWFALRGDASFAWDRPVEACQLRGRVVTVERGGRTQSLAIAGGALGRRLFVTGLRARAALVAATRRFALPAAPVLSAR